MLVLTAYHHESILATFDKDSFKAAGINVRNSNAALVKVDDTQNAMLHEVSSCEAQRLLLEVVTAPNEPHEQMVEMEPLLQTSSIVYPRVLERLKIP
jgi:hypothetical protein